MHYALHHFAFFWRKEPEQVSNHGIFDAAVYFAYAMLGNNVKI